MLYRLLSILVILLYQRCFFYGCRVQGFINLKYDKFRKYAKNDDHTKTVGAAVRGFIIAKWVPPSTSISYEEKEKDIIVMPIVYPHENVTTKDEDLSLFSYCRNIRQLSRFNWFSFWYHLNSSNSCLNDYLNQK